MTINIQSYQNVRTQFVNGDLLCCRGNNLFSWLIKIFTKSKYSHVGMVYWFQDNLYCIEAIGSGVSIVKMSKIIEHYKDGIDYYSVKNITDDQRLQAINFEFEQLGDPYNRIGILRFFWYIITKKMDKVREGKTWFCSELFTEAYDQIGIQLVNRTPAYVTPENLSESTQVEYKFSIK